MTGRPARRIRHADTKERLDLDQWPELDKIFYEFLVDGTGEAIAGPFWFGRAFDNPPFFSFSAVALGQQYGTPELTIGVSEWLRDEQDMYVGAMLWIRIKACFEPHLGGTDIFDVGFEQILIRTGGGPEGDELPRRITRGSPFGTIYVWHSTLTFDAQGLVGGFGEEVAVEPFMAPYNFVWMGPVGSDASGGEHYQTAIRVSKANPNTGLQHLRVTALADPLPPGLRLQNLLLAGALTPCRDDNKQSSQHRFPVWRINPGDKVTLDWDAMVSTLVGQSTNGGPWLLPDIFIGTVGLGELARFGPPRSAEWELTTSYQSYHAELVAPVDTPNDATYMFIALTTWRDAHASVAETYFDIDNVRLAISGTNQSLIPPSFEVSLNFEGLTLKGYGNIHKLDPKSAPVKVVLA